MFLHTANYSQHWVIPVKHLKDLMCKVMPSGLLALKLCVTCGASAFMCKKRKRQKKITDMHSCKVQRCQLLSWHFGLLKVEQSFKQSNDQRACRQDDTLARLSKQLHLEVKAHVNSPVMLQINLLFHRTLTLVSIRPITSAFLVWWQSVSRSAGQFIR